VRTRKWAIEGLAYLTNDADVKDDFVEDEAAMRAMFELAKVCERSNKPNREDSHVCTNLQYTYFSLIVKR